MVSAIKTKGVENRLLPNIHIVYKHIPAVIKTVYVSPSKPVDVAALRKGGSWLKNLEKGCFGMDHMTHRDLSKINRPGVGLVRFDAVWIDFAAKEREILQFSNIRGVPFENT